MGTICTTIQSVYQIVEVSPPIKSIQVEVLNVFPVLPITRPASLVLVSINVLLVPLAFI